MASLPSTLHAPHSKYGPVLDKEKFQKELVSGLFTPIQYPYGIPSTGPACVTFLVHLSSRPLQQEVVQKALQSSETPVKEKHIRSMLLGESVTSVCSSHPQLEREREFIYLYFSLFSRCHYSDMEGAEL